MFKHGFTLIELLVVVLIIGILSAIALPQYQIAVTTSKATAVVSFIHTIDLAESRYKLATGAYTTNFNDLDISMPGSGTMTPSGNSIDYNKFICSFHGSFDTYQSIICSMKGSFNIVFERYLDSVLICWAGDDPTGVKNSVCKKLSGKETADTVHPALMNGYFVFRK